MNAKPLIVSFAIAASVGAAFVPVASAAEGFQDLTRADMKALVLQARANGELRPAGEAPIPVEYAAARSTRTRDAVRAEVLQARAHGELIASGEAHAPFETTSDSTLSRAEVRNEVRLARAEGRLIPSGEGFGPMDRSGRAVPGETLAATSRR